MQPDNDALWLELEAPLRRYIRRRVRNRQDAEDLFQEVAVRIERHRQAVPPAGSRVRWALRIAHNLITDHYRSSVLRQHAPLDEVESGWRDEVMTSTRQLSRCVRTMVERLPQPYRDALVWADLEGMSQQTVADRMNLSLSGAKTRVQRARQQLHRLLLDCCEFERNHLGDIVDYHPHYRTWQAACHGGDR